MCNATCHYSKCADHSAANVGMQPVTSNQTGQPSQPGKLCLHSYFIFCHCDHTTCFSSKVNITSIYKFGVKCNKTSIFEAFLAVCFASKVVGLLGWIGLYLCIYICIVRLAY